MQTMQINATIALHRRLQISNCNRINCDSAPHLLLRPNLQIPERMIADFGDAPFHPRISVREPG